ncbi:GM16224 [Drosophila sechellia]|uniref:GM16224 n=1 Tax=Drosophila sechellia TaxID=7238 RepID=B4IPK7_DROSE|nr:GM16224 [Drosophila sechellia]
MDGMHRWPQLDALSVGLQSESIADPSDSSNLTQRTTPRNFCDSPDNEKRVEVTLNQSRPATNVRRFLGSGSGSGQWTVDNGEWWAKEMVTPRRERWLPVQVPLAHRLWAHSFHLAAHDLFMIITSFA